MNISRILFRLNELCTMAGAAMFVVMTLICFGQVLARYLFSSAMSWPEEAARFLFIWVAYLAMAYGMYAGAHLKVDAFTTLLNRRLQAWLEALSMLISTAFMVVVSWQGWLMLELVKDSEEVALTLPVPLYLVWFSIPFCFAVTGLYSLYGVFRALHGASGPESTATQEKETL